MPLDLHISTIGAAVFGVCMVASTLVWRLVPMPRRTRMAPKDAINLAILSTEIAHVRADITELKADVKELHGAVGRLYKNR